MMTWHVASPGLRLGIPGFSDVALTHAHSVRVFIAKRSQKEPFFVHQKIFPDGNLESTDAGFLL